MVYKMKKSCLSADKKGRCNGCNGRVFGRWQRDRRKAKIATPKDAQSLAPDLALLGFRFAGIANEPLASRAEMRRAERRLPRGLDEAQILALNDVLDRLEACPVVCAPVVFDEDAA